MKISWYTPNNEKNFSLMIVNQTCAASHKVKSSQSHDFDFFEKTEKSQSHDFDFFFSKKVKVMT